MEISDVNSSTLKISNQKLDKFNSLDNLTVFGDWINNIEGLNLSFRTAKPFPHLVIDNFLETSYATKISDVFPTDYKKWYHYNNPLEVKYTSDKINEFEPEIQSLFYILSTSQITELFSKISGIHNLEHDPCLHGAGLHVHPRNGRLGLHLDYEKHPYLQEKERRLNIIFFLNKEWSSSWKGDNQLWNKDLSNFVSTQVKFNRALIFQTNDISWHGLPDKIMCPENYFRKTFAYYYISPLQSTKKKNKFGNDGSGFRTKASYISTPNKDIPPQVKRLQEIRPHRRINPQDMEEIWPEWSPELY